MGTGIGTGIGRHVGLLLVVGLLCCTASPSASASASGVGLDGRLYRFVLVGAGEANGGLTPTDEATLPADVRARITQVRDRMERFHSRLQEPAGGIDEDGKDGFLAKRHTERMLVALFDRPGIEAIAAAYAKDSVHAYEYEGDPGGPLGEAAYARDYLKAHPRTILAPYLHLFLAYRYRAAFETQVEAKDHKAAAVSAHRYREAIAGARAARDPLIRAAAEDLDRQPGVYMPPPSSVPHPRDYK